MTTQTKNYPTHRIYAVSGNGENANWTPIGATWPNKDGKGYTLSLDAVPLTGRIVMREVQPKEADDQGALS